VTNHVAHNRLDLTDQKFGRLLAIRTALLPNGNERGGYWECICDCGGRSTVSTKSLRSGTTRSCGCLKFDEHPAGADHASYKHGHNMLNSPTYVSWQAMRRRVKGQHRYADRGITIDPRWQSSFENFLADMGERPEGTTIDRIDNDGPYTAANCRWASKDVQDNNRENARHVTYDGRTQTVAQWAREVGLSRGVLYNRIVLYGWGVQRSLETPVLDR
jgi:hypothetical protein